MFLSSCNLQTIPFCCLRYQEKPTRHKTKLKISLIVRELDAASENVRGDMYMVGIIERRVKRRRVCSKSYLSQYRRYDMGTRNRRAMRYQGCAGLCKCIRSIFTTVHRRTMSIVVKADYWGIVKTYQGRRIAISPTLSLRHCGTHLARIHTDYITLHCTPLIRIFTLENYPFFAINVTTPHKY